MSHLSWDDGVPLSPEGCNAYLADLYQGLRDIIVGGARGVKLAGAGQVVHER